MQTADIWDHAIDWIWTVIAGVFVVIARAIVKLRGIEERVKALEVNDERREETIADLIRKVDENHDATRQHIDSRVEDIRADQRTATDGIRADLRIIMNRCLAAQKDCQ